MPYVYVDTYNEMLQKEYSLNKKVNSMTEEMEKLKQDVNNLAEYNADLKSLITIKISLSGTTASTVKETQQLANHHFSELAESLTENKMKKINSLISQIEKTLSCNVDVETESSFDISSKEYIDFKDFSKMQKALSSIGSPSKNLRNITWEQLAPHAIIEAYNKKFKK
jgi:alanyl-tRNA synthetase